MYYYDNAPYIKPVSVTCIGKYNTSIFLGINNELEKIRTVWPFEFRLANFIGLTKRRQSDSQDRSQGVQ